MEQGGKEKMAVGRSSEVISRDLGPPPLSRRIVADFMWIFFSDKNSWCNRLEPCNHS